MNYKFEIPDELVYGGMPKESVEKDLTEEIEAVVGDIEAWYFNRDDYRQEWIPSDYEPKNKELIEDITKKVKKQLSTAEELPSVVDEEKIVLDLAGLVETWDNWYPNYKKTKDQYSWTYEYGEDREIYQYSDYGNPDEMVHTYWDEDEPYEEDELEVVFDNIAA